MHRLPELSGGEVSAPGVQPRYQLHSFAQEHDFLSFVEEEKRQIDCLIIEDSERLQRILWYLRDRTILLPLLVLETSASPTAPIRVASSDESLGAVEYHDAVIWVSAAQLDQFEHLVEQAISQFLKLPAPALPADPTANPVVKLTSTSSLLVQQHRLADKLKERLGYLGVYYKRNPAHFLRHMTQPEKQELLDQLKADYREIILSYFSGGPVLNEKIDSFVNIAFFADVPVSQIVEIHMELMDEFSKQLKLEGRSDEILLDYRLTLIDAIAHLCEMYRRSIPREP